MNLPASANVSCNYLGQEIHGTLLEVGCDEAIISVTMDPAGEFVINTYGDNYEIILQSPQHVQTVEEVVELVEEMAIDYSRVSRMVEA